MRFTGEISMTYGEKGPIVETECSWCKGTGEITDKLPNRNMGWSMREDKKCPICDGSGIVMMRRQADDDGKRD